MALGDEALRAISGPGGRHAALIEDAFHVLMETPGGGVSLNGDAKARRGARQAVEILANRVASKLDVTPADVRVGHRSGAIGIARCRARRPAWRCRREDSRPGAISRRSGRP